MLTFTKKIIKCKNKFILIDDHNCRNFEKHFLVKKKKKKKKRKENQPVTNLKLHLNPYNYIVNQKRRLCTYCFKNDKKETNTLVIVIHVIFRFVLKRTGLSYTMPSESLLENVFNYKFI